MSLTGKRHIFNDNFILFIHFTRHQWEVCGADGSKQHFSGWVQHALKLLYLPYPSIQHCRASRVLFSRLIWALHPPTLAFNPLHATTVRQLRQHFVVLSTDQRQQPQQCLGHWWPGWAGKSHQQQTLQQLQPTAIAIQPMKSKNSKHTIIVINNNSINITTSSAIRPGENE